jgi:hypothetical protein
VSVLAGVFCSRLDSVLVEVLAVIEGARETKGDVGARGTAVDSAGVGGTALVADGRPAADVAPAAAAAYLRGGRVGTTLAGGAPPPDLTADAIDC